MRNKENVIRLCEKIEGLQQQLLFILKRPNADVEEFRQIIEKTKDEATNIRMFVDREEDSL
jgi:hypothetical protein|tara:strand:- start:584 stop:766 length:183 start_codon:yes stop_codon:yes gene_type:complete